MAESSPNYTMKEIKDGLSENCTTAGRLSSMMRSQQVAMAEAGVDKISPSDRSFFNQLKEMNEISEMYIDFLTNLVDVNRGAPEAASLKTDGMTDDAIKKMANMIEVSLAFPAHMLKVTVTQ